MLNALCARVLDVLEQGTASQEALVHCLRESLPDVQVHEVSSLLEEVIDTLSRIGVIETLEDAS